jgi:hypothetical protein
MSLRARIEKLEKRFNPNNFCGECMRLVFRHADEPDSRPAVCPSCNRGPDDYPSRPVRVFVLHRPAVYGLKELPGPPEPAGPRADDPEAAEQQHDP